MLGLTGGIASGKSTVSQRLKELGAFVIDADEVSRTVAESPAVIAELKKTFGEDIADEGGRLKRRELAARAFASDDSAQRLNAIMHPAIMGEIKSRRAYAEASGCYPLIFIDAALLIESGFNSECSGVWLVTCGEETRVERIMQRDGLTESEARQRIARQMSDSQKSLYASRIIENDGTLGELIEKVDNAYAYELGSR